ncbi:MAG: peptide-methionine (R)-S-oxide reductase MsrB [Burkholderiales bacterium]
MAHLQGNRKSLFAADADMTTTTEPVKLVDAEWRQRLGSEAYRVMRHGGTERAGSSPLNTEKRPGMFVCEGCRLPLFTSAMKFDSGTGWPSFFAAIPGTLVTKKDYRLRIQPGSEYHCARCGAHHGHVFDDGPEPTGLRYCNNGVALRFIPRAEKT